MTEAVSNIRGLPLWVKAIVAVAIDILDIFTLAVFDFAYDSFTLGILFILFGDDAVIGLLEFIDTPAAGGGLDAVVPVGTIMVINEYLELVEL